MKPNQLLTIVLLLTSIGVNGQSAHLHAVTSSGATFRGADLTLSWTLGEVVTGVFANEDIAFGPSICEKPQLVTGIDEAMSVSIHEGILLFPNPSSDLVHLHFTKLPRWFKVSLLDSKGKSVLEWSTEDSRSNLLQRNDQGFSLDISSFSNGVYQLIVLSETSGIFNHTIIKEGI